LVPFCAKLSVANACEIFEGGSFYLIPTISDTYFASARNQETSSSKKRMPGGVKLTRPHLLPVRTETATGKVVKCLVLLRTESCS
jgi:hypothetical protein